MEAIVQRPAVAEGSGAKLRRELRIWETLALSIGIASPALAMSFSGPGAAANVGRAVPLAFLFAAVGLAFVASGMVVVSRLFSHAGSVYGLTGATIGPRSGFFSGWALLGCYVIFTPASLVASGYFVALFFHDIGLVGGTDYIVFSLLLVALCWFLNLVRIRNLTRTLLTVEGISVTLLIILMIVIVARLASGGSPTPGATLTGSIFTLPSGIGFHEVPIAAVFAFLAFAGFEGAMSLGEECQHPRRDIPRALIYATIGISVFYVLCMACQSLGFGATTKGAQAFANSSGPVFDLSRSYVGRPLAEVLELGAAISAFGSALGSAAGAARLVFALTRDSLPGSTFATVTRGTGAPASALALTMIFAGVATIVVRVLGVTGLNAWQYFGTVGTLLLLVAYALVDVAAIKILFEKRQFANLTQALGPVIGILFLVYVLYNQLYPVPASPYNVFPYAALAWLLVGLAIALLVPGLAARIGKALSQQEGLTSPERVNASTVGPAS